jgi:hypothetical protein
MGSTDLTNQQSRQPASSGTPTSDTKTGGTEVVPIGTVETVLLDINLGGGNRTVNVGFCNISAGATSVTVYFKPVTFPGPSGTPTPAAAANANTIVKAFAMPTTGDPVAFQALQGLVVPANAQLTALVTVGAAASVNAFVSGTAQR